MSATAVRTRVPHLRVLEAEAVHVIREVVVELSRPVLLFSGGKNSIALLRVAEKAFRPSPMRFRCCTSTPATTSPRRSSSATGACARPGTGSSSRRSRTRSTGAACRRTRPARRATGCRRRRSSTRSRSTTSTPRSAARAATRSERARRSGCSPSATSSAQWEPRAQRPEPWALYNARIRRGEHIRVFPLSNWTELDVWRYIEAEDLELPWIYFAHRRRVIERDGILLAESEWVRPQDGERVEEATVRYRTVGDLTVTGAVRSEATDVAAVVAEIEASRISECGETRADDRTSEAAMEDRKREGYF
jgi:sulfate adenylyltransferase subunit 2